MFFLEVKYKISFFKIVFIFGVTSIIQFNYNTIVKLIFKNLKIKIVALFQVYQVLYINYKSRYVVQNVNNIHFVGAVNGLFVVFLFGLLIVSMCIVVPQTLVDSSVNIVSFEFVFDDCTCCFLILGVQTFRNLTSS